MAMGTERSKALHNFTMPRDLRWGNQRFLRCMKVNSSGRISPLHHFAGDDSCSPDQRQRNASVQQPRTERGREKGFITEILNGSFEVSPATTPPSDGRRRFSCGDDDGIAAIREKVMFDLQTAADKMKVAIFKDGQVSGSPTQPGTAAEGEVHRPWNLRTRRAACKTPASKFVSSTNGSVATGCGDTDGADGRGLIVDVPKPDPLISQKKSGLTAASDKSPRPSRDGGEPTASGIKRERAKFSLALSKSDIEEDYMEMVGRRPPRRPKKRARNIQRQMDCLFPGLLLTEVKPDMYIVSEVVS